MTHRTYTLQEWLTIIGRLENIAEYEAALWVFEEQQSKLSVFNRIQLKTQFIAKQTELLRASHNITKN